MGQQLIARAGASRTRLLVLTMIVVALLTALINPNGSVAALVPVVVVMAVRLGLPPSQLLMPAAFAAHAGSLLALTGTPVSVVVSEAAAEAGARPFGFFEFALVGVPLLLGTIAIVVLFGGRLLPQRTPRQLPPDFGEHFKVLTEQYGLDQRTHRLAVGPRSPLIGHSPDDLDLKHYPSLALTGVQGQGQGGLVKDAVFAADDVLLLRGEAEAAERLRARGVPVRAAHRRPIPADGPPLWGGNPGVADVELDFLRPETYPGALRGVERLFLMRPPQLSDVLRQIAPLIDAAAVAGVRHVVVLSLLGAERNRVVPHRKIEDHVRALGLPYTFLRPSFFMQNLTTAHRSEIRDEDELFMPAGRGRTSFIDARDIGEVAARVLSEPGHEGQAYPLTGSEALTYDEVASTLSGALSRPIFYRPASLPGFARRLRARGLPWGQIAVMAAIYTTCRLGLAGAITPDAARLLGRSPTTLWQFAQDHRRLCMPDGRPAAS